MWYGAGSIGYATANTGMRGSCREVVRAEREFFIDNLLVRIHFIIEMIWWTGLAP